MYIFTYVAFTRFERLCEKMGKIDMRITFHNYIKQQHFEVN